MTGKIFINYRRDDCRADAARVRDRLAQAYGDANVFMDVDNLLVGQRFDRELEKALDQCDVFLAIIGPHWMKELQVRQRSNERDYVREEIAGALKRGTLVIPVLIEGTPLPRADQLPEDIRSLVMHHKHDLAHESFGRDAAALIDGIRATRNAALIRPPLRGRTKAGVAVVIAFIGMGLVALPFLARQVHKPDVTPTSDKAIPGPVQGGTEPKQTVDLDPVLKKLRLEDAEKATEPHQEAGEVFRDCPDCPEMVVIPTGTLDVFAAGRMSAVPMPHPFAVGRTEITYSQWHACVEQRQCRPAHSAADVERSDKPVVNVDWFDVGQFIKWISKRTNQPYRLLSELEWQYVASAGSRWPDEAAKRHICAYGNIADKTLEDDKTFADIPKANCYDSSGVGTLAVGSLKPNPWGLFDTIGNAAEWVADCKADVIILMYLKGKAATQVAPADCHLRAVRGGSWKNSPAASMPSFRLFSVPGAVDDNIGFRIARDLR